MLHLLFILLLFHLFGPILGLVIYAVLAIASVPIEPDYRG